MKIIKIIPIKKRLIEIILMQIKMRMKIKAKMKMMKIKVKIISKINQFLQTNPKKIKIQ